MTLNSCKYNYYDYEYLGRQITVMFNEYIIKLVTDKLVYLDSLYHRDYLAKGTEPIQPKYNVT